MQHVVKRGETLAKIARKYGVSTDDIKALNDIENDVVQRGQLLMIPVVEKGSQAASAAEYKAETKQSANAASKAEATPTTYKVRKGDTLGKIADKFGTTVDAIMQANGMSNSEIMVGQTLQISGKAKGSKSAAPPPTKCAAATPSVQ